MKTKDLTKMAICIALLSVSAYLSFPLPFSPAMVTAQTIVVNVIALLLTPKQAFITVAIYLLMGIIGMPVFSGGASGIASVLRPSGGFLLAFLMAAPLMSFVKERFNVSIKNFLFITIGIGMPVIYLIGAVWMSYVTQMGFVEVLYAAVIPFIIGDVFKCVVASVVVERLEHQSTRRLTASYE